MTQYISGFLASYTAGNYLSDSIIWGPIYYDLNSQENYYREQLKTAMSIEERIILEDALKKTVHNKAAVAFNLGVGVVKTTWGLVSPSPSHSSTFEGSPCE